MACKRSAVRSRLPPPIPLPAPSGSIQRTRVTAGFFMDSATARGMTAKHPRHSARSPNHPSFCAEPQPSVILRGASTIRHSARSLNHPSFCAERSEVAESMPSMSSTGSVDSATTRGMTAKHHPPFCEKPQPPVILRGAKRSRRI